MTAAAGWGEAKVFLLEWAVGSRIDHGMAIPGDREHH